MNEPRAARQRIRAPQESGSALIVPPVSQGTEMVRKNRELLAGEQISFLDNLSQFQQTARREMLAAAIHYTQQYRDVAGPMPDVAGPIFLAGHQPQLFHPGVWFKNFLLSSLAENVSGTAVNLVVDNDTQRHASLAVPTGSLQNPQVTAIPFDAPAVELPFEERTILDQQVWSSFSQRTLAAIRPLAEAAGWDVDDFILQHLSAGIQTAGQRTNRLGLAFAQARHHYEGACGLTTWELPLSTLCQQASFRHFTLGLLRDLPRLHQVYNHSLREYRRENRLRSHSHPAPDLERSADHWEVPLWIWSSSSPRRQRAFARWQQGELRLTDRQQLSVVIPPANPIAAWSDAEAVGIKIRPRAFLTTMFARLILGDVFIHGIGGAKYDEVTDRLIAELAGCTPPQFITATATIPLPLPLPAITLAELRQTQDLQRQLLFHPERFTRDADATIDDATWHEWLREKTQLLAEHPPRGAGKPRQQAIHALNHRLTGQLTTQQQRLKATATEQLAAIARRTLLANREYSLVLHPAGKLCPQLVDLCVIKS